MDPINSLGRLLRLTKSKVSESKKQGIAKSGQKQVAGQKASPSAINSLPVEAFKAQLADALGKLDLQDTEQQTQAMRVFVKETLAWQFGKEILHDPNLSALVDEVTETLLNDPVGLEGLKAVGNRKRP